MWVGILILLGVMAFSVLKIIIEEKEKERLREEKRKEEQRKREEARRKAESLAEARRQKEQVYEKLTQKYPYGVASYTKQNPSATIFDIVGNETKIKSLDILGREYELFTKWSEHQSAFASKSRKLYHKGWGCYYYDISLLGVDDVGEEKYYSFRIWQHYLRSYCTETNLDYTHFPHINANLEKRIKFLHKNRWLKSFVYDEIIDLIQKLSENIVVLFAGSGTLPEITPYSDSLNKFHFEYLRGELDKRGIRYWDIEYDSFTIDDGQEIVIVELDTTNKSLKETCKRVFEKFKKHQPCITYISVFKEYSLDEMSELISDYEKKAREEEERRQAEEERKRQEVENKKRTTNALKAAVSSWESVPYCDIPHAFLIRYYPTTCDFDATDDEWYDRQLIWSFKNDPNKVTRIPHDRALEELLPLVEEKLKASFGNLLSNLTLVCIPASSPAKNTARYQLFSTQLCESTGMTNAYSHMVVNGERVARHEGGVAGETDEVTFDDAFFKEKNVLLFDDLLTRGDSMRKFGRKMASLGANVIASFTIGKTFHHREDDFQLGTYQPTYYDDDPDDDIPF